MALEGSRPLIALVRRRRRGRPDRRAARGQRLGRERAKPARLSQSLTAVLAALAVAVAAARRMARPRPALPENCGDCVYMLPRAKIYRRETIEDEDGLVHYLCQQRWIEVTPYSERCELGKSKTRTTVAAR